MQASTTESSFIPEYTFERPSELLTPVVDCLFQIKDSCNHSLPREHYALPDVCPEIVINLGGAYCREDMLTGKKEIIPSGACKVIGQRDRSFRIVLIDDRWDIISIKLKPFGLYMFFGITQSILLNKAVAGETIFGRRINQLIKSLLLLDEDSARITMVQTFLEDHPVSEAQDEITVAMVDLIKQNRGIVKIEKLCDQFGITYKTLENRFRNQIGIGPKEFCSIIQFNNFLIKSTRDNKNLTELALECGYYDQAHLIRKFRSVTNSTPKKHFSVMNYFNSISIDILFRQLAV